MSAPGTGELRAHLQALAAELPAEERLELIEHLTGAGVPTGSVEPVDPVEIRETYERYLQRHQFSAGQLVRWKTGLRNKRLPEPGQPAIVIEVLEPGTVSSEERTDSPYFRETLDLVLGVVDGERDLVFFHFDGRRFEPLDS